MWIISVKLLTVILGKTRRLATWCEELTHWKRPWCWESLKAGGEGDNGEWDGWMASPTWWTWIRANSRSWWWTQRPGMLQPMGSQRVRHDWATKRNWTEEKEYWMLWVCILEASGLDVKGCFDQVSLQQSFEEWVGISWVKAGQLRAFQEEGQHHRGHGGRLRSTCRPARPRDGARAERRRGSWVQVGTWGAPRVQGVLC